MDIPRPPQKKYKRFLLPGGLALLLIGITYEVSQLDPRAPSVPRTTLYTGDVKRGEMVRQVHGNGTLVPERIRWVSSISNGRVERLLVERGARVSANTVILELTNPDVQREMLDAEQSLALAEATLLDRETSIKTQRLSWESRIASSKAASLEAQRQLRNNEDLFQQKIIPRVDVERSREVAEDRRTQYDTDLKLFALFEGTIESQLSVQQSNVERAKRSVQLAKERVAGLHVTPGEDGVLQELTPEIGQWVNSGGTIAKVVQPERLKAVLRIQENQVKDVIVGQRAEIDTRNGIIQGHVTRIDVAPLGGTVAVDIALEGELPTGARVDLSVDGTIELERIPDVLWVTPPVFPTADATVQVFKMSPDGKEAFRVAVRFGRRSVTQIEIIPGLEVGDRIMLNTMDDYAEYDRVRIDG